MAWVGGKTKLCQFPQEILFMVQSCNEQPWLPSWAGILGLGSPPAAPAHAVSKHIFSLTDVLYLCPGI